MANPFYTIGHATRPLDAFESLLKSAEVLLVVDVRAIPRSRTNPQYNGDVLPASLAAVHIGYEHIVALGGRRGGQPSVPRATNAFWKNRSFHNYADYAMGEEFQAGFHSLRKLGLRERCAIMCAETLWWQCHRRIISDYLIAAGEIVFHILGPRQFKQAQMTSGAKVATVGTITYPTDSD
jgi:uncharacterized protein (DUF488 family)